MQHWAEAIFFYLLNHLAVTSYRAYLRFSKNKMHYRAMGRKFSSAYAGCFRKRVFRPLTIVLAWMLLLLEYVYARWA